MKAHKIVSAACDAALSLAAETPWSDISLRDIAAAADVPLSDLYAELPTRTDIVDALAVRFDRAAADDLELEPDATVRERLFDATMARFDAMEPHRAGLVSILDAARLDPVLAARGWTMTLRSARWLLELAGVDTSGVRGLARVNGFAVILARAGRAWMKDEHGDLSRTMAALDRSLRDMEEWGDRVKNFRWPRPRDETPPREPADGEPA